MDDWAKASIDIAKIALIGIPAIIYSDKLLDWKALNLLALGAIMYLFLAIARYARQRKIEKLKEQQTLDKEK